MLQCTVHINMYILTIAMQDESEIAAKKSLDVMIELYKKRVWTDARTVNVIATALDSTVTKLVTTALNFFLSIDTKIQDEDDAEEANANKPTDVNFHEHAKKTAATARKVAKQIKERK
jgi:protein SDA1